MVAITVSASALSLRPSTPMSSRRRPSSALTPTLPSARLLAALQSLELPECDCKLTMLPVCVVGREPGCRERRRSGSCSCTPRWLPECLLWQAHGCERHRSGKRCGCDLLLMPNCLALGCDKRRRGHQCECPRWPGEPCRHVVEKARQLAIDSPQEAEAFAAAWADQLWELLPDQYKDFPLADEGTQHRAGPEAVLLMEARASLFLSLWHPDDERWPPGEARRRMARGYGRLLGRISQKGGDRGAS